MSFEVGIRAYNSCTSNTLLTGMYPDSFHAFRQHKKPDFSGYAKCHTRTRCPPKYYLTDFGISRRYNPGDGPPLEDPIWGGDKTVPEFQKSNDPRDPFPTDVYYLGNLIQSYFLVVSHSQILAIVCQ